MTRLSTILAATSIALLLTAAGCSKQPALDPAMVAEHRMRLTLAEEPDGALTVLDVHRTMFGEDADAHDEHAHEEDEAATGEHAENESAAADKQGEEEHAHEEEHAEEEHAAHEHEEEDHAHADHEHGDPVISEMDVVLVGTVGGVANPSDQLHPDFPFVEQEAVFFLADPEAVAEMEEHAHVHKDGEECAFCAAHAADSAHALAIVQFTGDNGEPLAVGVRDLFGLKEMETVVVTGKAKMSPAGIMTVDATGLYVRR